MVGAIVGILVQSMTVQLHYTNSHWSTQLHQSVSANESWYSEAVLPWMALEILQLHPPFFKNLFLGHFLKFFLFFFLGSG